MGESVRVQGTVPKELYEQALDECPALADDDSALLTYVLQRFVDDRELDRRRAGAPKFLQPESDS